MSDVIQIVFRKDSLAWFGERVGKKQKGIWKILEGRQSGPGERLEWLG